MDFFQWTQDPWGREILVRISWSLFWLAAAGGLVFIVGHLVFRWWSAKRSPTIERPADPDASRRIPERIVRHPLASRLFHWTMSASMFVLLFTGFLPVLGVKFSWVTIHWVAGLVLVGTVVFHIIHASFWLKLGDIWISRRDLSEWWIETKRNLGRPLPPPPKPGKYPMENKFFHHLVLLTTFAVIGTASGRQLPWAPQEDAKIPCCSVNAAASGGFRGYPQRKKGTRITSQESALAPTIKNSLFLGDQRSSFALSG